MFDRYYGTEAKLSAADAVHNGGQSEPETQLHQTCCFYVSHDTNGTYSGHFLTSLHSTYSYCQLLRLFAGLSVARYGHISTRAGQSSFASKLFRFYGSRFENDRYLCA